MMIVEELPLSLMHEKDKTQFMLIIKMVKSCPHLFYSGYDFILTKVYFDIGNFLT